MSKKINKDIYYSKAPMVVYESFISRILNKFFHNYSREEVASEMKLEGVSCLDIACGDGELINRHLFNRFDVIHGVDISKNLIDIARTTKKENVTFFVQDIDEYIDKSIKNEKKYDVIYILAFLEHIQWPTYFIERVHKLIKKGGHVVIETPNIAWFPYRLSMAFGKFPVTAPTVGVIPGVYDEHIRFFTHETLDKMMLNTGFRKIRNDCSGKFRLIKNLFPSFLSPDIVAIYRKK